MKVIKSSSLLTLVLLLGILFLINAIAVRNFVRFDLTSQKVYSLTDASKNIVSEIPDKLIVKAFFTPDMPSPYNTLTQYIRDLLEDYRAYSKGHLQYEFIDPGSEDRLQEEAQTFNIPPQQVQTIENDKIEVKLCYMGIAFIYGDKQEVIPVVSGGNLEYEVTSLIKRLTAEQLPVLGIASTGSMDDQVETQQLYEALARAFDVRQANIFEPIPDSYDGLLLIAPRQRLTDWQLFNIDQYIMKGGKVAIMANKYFGDLRTQMPYSQRDLNLDGFLEHYGAPINGDLLYDNECGSISVQMSQGMFVMNQQVRLPYFPIIRSFNRENMITRSLEGLPLFFASSIDTTFAAGKGYDIEGLLYTSEHSGRDRASSVNINVLRRWTESDYTEAHIPVGAVVSGKFTSYFAETGAPPVSTMQSDGQIVTESEPWNGTVIPEVDELNRLLVVGDGNIALDEFSYPYGLMFTLNAADWLVQAEDLITIRSKQIPLRPLKESSEFAKKMVKWANQVGPVVLVILFGMLLWQIRRIRKKALMAQ